MASALAMDKWRTKLVWLASGIPTPRYRVVDARTDWMRVVAELGLPLIVKPAREGSTIGITKVASVDHDELALAYAEAAKHDDLVLVEEFVAGTELTASILGGRALPLIRIEAPQGNYDYHNKYFSDDTKYFCPAGLADAKEQRDPRGVRCARSTSSAARGWGRLDLILRAGRHVLVPRSEHVAGHDRPQPGADGGEGRPACRSPTCASKSCEARMWDDARQMNAIAAALALLAVAAPRLGRGSRGCVRQPAFAFREVVVHGAARARRARAHLEAVDPRGAHRHVLHDGPRPRARRARRGCRGCATSRCAGSGRTGSRSTIEEHEPLARWNDAALVNTHGEVFDADCNGELPQFDGPDGRVAADDRRAIASGRDALAPLALDAATQCGCRRAAAGDCGARRRGAADDRARPRRADARLARFVAAYGRTIGALARAGTRVEHVDLRYRNGFAARVPGFREKSRRRSRHDAA